MTAEDIERSRFNTYIALEMKEASRGSFPLSPGVMSGHYSTANLYWHFRRDYLSTQTITGLFGKEDPDPLELVIPGGHRVVSPDGLNKSVWKSFLDIAFKSRPVINPESKLRTLILVNAAADNTNFDLRIKGEKSKLVNAKQPTPSLLIAFLYQNAFPEKNLFFSWLMQEMRQQVNSIVKDNFTGTGGEELKTLIGKWNRHFPHK